MSTQPLSAPRWHDDCAGRLICIDWNRWLRSGEFVDPYLVWADVSRFQGMGGWCAGGEGAREHDGTWPLLVEIEPCVDVQTSDTKVVAELEFAMAWMEIPGIYTDTAPKLRGRFFTARVPPDSIPYLLASPVIRRFQLGLPRINARQQNPLATGDVQGGDNQKSRVVMGIIDDGCAFAHTAFCDAQGHTRVQHLWDQDPARTLDEGQPGPWGWAHVPELGYGAELGPAALRAASGAAQESRDESSAYERVDYGPMRLGLDETATSLAWGGRKMPGTAMRRSSHGTSVMYLAAGVGERQESTDLATLMSYASPLRQQRAVAAAPAVERTHVTTGEDRPTQTDFATQWPLIFVQLPTRTILDTSGGSLGVHVLDALMYVAKRAAQIPNESTASGPAPDAGSRRDLPPDGRKYDNSHSLVVVISYGAVAGCHDGTSIIERAIADFVDAKADRWVCLAAGNQHRTRTHARLSLAGQQSGSFLWTVGPDNPSQSFLEVWFPDQDEQGHDMQEIPSLSLVVDLQPPGGLDARRIRCGELWICEGPAVSGKEPPVLAGAIFSRRVAQGLRGTMLLLAVAGTRADEPGASAHGEWRVTVTNEREASASPEAMPKLVVHAWAERNDLLYGNQRPQQSTVVSTDAVPQLTEFMPEARHFFDPSGRWWGNRHLPDELLPSNTLGSLAGLRRKATQGAEEAPPSEYKVDVGNRRGWPVSVGAYRLADGEVSAYSSGGPSRHTEHRHDHNGHPERHRQSACELPETLPADGPAASAPADVGPALRGLRTVGVRAGSVARLSGTSAAAPSVARAIANMAYAEIWNLTRSSTVGQFGIVNQKLPDSSAPTGESRATPTPQKDDCYRRGRWHVR